MEKPEFNVKPQALPGKTRVAHEVKHTEVHTHSMANFGNDTPEQRKVEIDKVDIMN